MIAVQKLVELLDLWPVDCDLWATADTFLEREYEKSVANTFRIRILSYSKRYVSNSGKNVCLLD